MDWIECTIPGRFLPSTRPEIIAASRIFHPQTTAALAPVDDDSGHQCISRRLRSCVGRGWKACRGRGRRAVPAGQALGGFPARVHSLVPGRGGHHALRHRSRRDQSGQRGRIWKEDRLRCNTAPGSRAGARPNSNNRERGGALLKCWAPLSRAAPFARKSMPSSITWRIWHRRSSCRRSKRRSRVGGRLRRLRQRRLGRRPGQAHRVDGRDLFPAFARDLLSGAHPISRLSALRRRVQGDGPRPLWRADASWTRCADRAAAGRRHFPARPRYFRHHREKIAYEWEAGAPTCRRSVFTRARSAARARTRGTDEPLDAATRDIARSVQAMYEEAFFHLLDTCTSRYRARRDLRSRAAAR